MAEAEAEVEAPRVEKKRKGSNGAQHRREGAKEGRREGAREASRARTSAVHDLELRNLTLILPEPQH